jgi:hypothetical protein
MPPQTERDCRRQWPWCRRLLCVPAIMWLVLPAQAQDRIKATPPERVHSNATAVNVRQEATGVAAAVRAPGPANDGAGFQLICRGGPALRIDVSEPWMTQTDGDFRFKMVSSMTVGFERSTQPPDGAGRNLQPGQCSPADFALRDSDPAQIRDKVDVGDTWRNLPNAAESLPRAGNIPAYLKDPSHYWSFQVDDSGDGYFRSADSRYWKPDFYKGPVSSATYPSTRAAAALAGAFATTTQATSSRYGGVGTRVEGHAGTPAVPTPAVPAPPAPSVVEPDPAAPVVFNPPLLEDGAQLWACVDAAAGEADADGCSGEASAQAYCQLRDAQSGPGLLIGDAQPGTPVRAVNHDICQSGDACRVISTLQCDH